MTQAEEILAALDKAGFVVLRRGEVESLRAQARTGEELRSSLMSLHDELGKFLGVGLVSATLQQASVAGSATLYSVER